MHKIGNNNAAVITKKNTLPQISSNRSVVVSSNVTGTITTSLPSGWKREEILKPNGLYAGKTDIYYTSPSGQKVRSKAELQKALGQTYDVSNFDWRSGKFTASRKRSTAADDSPDSKVVKMMEEYQQCLIRSGPNLFGKDRQPIVEATHSDSKIVDEINTSHMVEEAQDCPRQLFWHKRLADSCSSNPDTSNDRIRCLELPKEIQNAGVPGIDNNQLLQSIVSCIYNSNKTNTAVVGQTQQKCNIEKNPCLSLTVNQPLVKQVIITDDIIHRQEAKVKDLRRKLELVRRSLLPKLRVGEAA